MAVADLPQPAIARGGRVGATAAAAILSFTLLALTLVSWLTLDWSPAMRPEVLLGIWLNVLIMLLAILFEARRRPYSLHLMHLVAMFLFLGAASLFQYSVGILGVAGPIEAMQDQIGPTVVAVTLWLGAYLAGYEGYRLIVRGPQHGPMQRFLSRAVTPLRATLVLACALLSLVYLASLGLGGAETRGAAESALIRHTNEAGAGELSIAYLLIHGVLLRGFSIIALLAIVLVLAREKSARRPAVVLLAVVTGGALLFANNPFAASRMWFATVVIAFAAPLVLQRQRTGWGLTAIALAGIALLPALHETRYVESLDEVIDYVGLVSPVAYLSTNSDVDSLGMAALCVQWSQANEPRFGLQTLGSLLFWFPRAFWPDKPIETGAMVTRDLGFEFTNLAPPIMSDAIVDFGLFGVPLIAALYGLLLARLDRAYWEAPERGAAVRVIDCIYPLWIGCVLFMTRGGSFASFTYTVGFTAWIVVLGFGGRLPRIGTSAAQRS
jgi:hypothetical protein